MPIIDVHTHMFTGAGSSSCARGARRPASIHRENLRFKYTASLVPDT